LEVGAGWSPSFHRVITASCKLNPFLPQGAHFRFAFSFSMARCALKLGPKAFWKSVGNALAAASSCVELRERCKAIKQKGDFIDLFHAKNAVLFGRRVVVAIDEFDRLFCDRALLGGMMTALRVLKETPMAHKALQVFFLIFVSLFYL